MPQRAEVAGSTAQQTPLLTGADRFRGAGEATADRPMPAADLDEHEFVAVAHDQVEFAVAAMPVALDEGQSSGAQRIERPRFRISAAISRAASQREVTTRGSGIAPDSAMTAQISVRSIWPLAVSFKSPVTPAS